MLTLETALRLAGIPVVLLSVFYWAVVIPGAIGMTVAWCVLLRKAGVPWGFQFIPFFGDFCHFRIARGVDLFITKWCVIGGTLTAALIQLNTPTVDPAFYLILFYIPAVMVLLIVEAAFSHQLAEVFGRSSAFGSGLFWVRPVFLLILAFSKRSRYYGGTVLPGSRPGSPAPITPLPVRKAPDWTCLACGAGVPDSLRFCPHCGVTRGTRPERLPHADATPAPAPVRKPAPAARTGVWRCPGCGREVPENLRFCASCGRLRYEAAPARTPPTADRPAALAVPTDAALSAAPKSTVPPAPAAPAEAPKVSLVKEPAAAQPPRPTLAETIPGPEPRESAPVLETEDARPQWKCTVCGAYMPAEAAVCTVCGVDRAPDTPILTVPDTWWLCASCGARNADRHRTCTHCGAPR